MKLFSFILSVMVFFTSLFFFAEKIQYVESLNDTIYISLLAILMVICIIGMIINWDLFRERKKSKVILFVANNFSRKKK